MITDLKPYVKYKESGLPWLGQVPGHWSVTRIKTVLRETDRRSVDGAGTLLSLTRVRGLIPHRDMTDKMHSAKTLVGYKCYHAGQLVMNRMQAWSGMFGAGEIDGLVSPDYAVFDVLGGHAIKLVLERLKTPDMVGQFALESKGIGSGFNRLYTDRFGPISISLPPLDEQAAIVRFLDWTNGRLERAIRAKRKVIALLNEQKQAIIHRAVTRGLDPTVSLKPSGSRWFPDLPDKWAVLTLRRVITAAIDGPHFSPQYFDTGIPFLSARNVKADRWSLGDAKFISEMDFKEFCRRVRPEIGDVLYTKGGTTGVARSVDLEFPFQVWVHIAVLKLNRQRITPRFLAFCLNSPRCYEQSQLFTRGATNQDLGLGRMKEIELPVPPTLAEQECIVEALNTRLVEFSTTISRLEREIELLREYRTRLVADVVTGKLDVRAAAAQLPDESPSDTTEDDADIDIDAEPENEEAAE